MFANVLERNSRERLVKLLQLPHHFFLCHFLGWLLLLLVVGIIVAAALASLCPFPRLELLAHLFNQRIVLCDDPILLLNRRLACHHVCVLLVTLSLPQLLVLMNQGHALL